MVNEPSSRKCANRIDLCANMLSSSGIPNHCAALARTALMRRWMHAIPADTTYNAPTRREHQQ